MSKRKHSFIQFYMDDWAAGTMRMPRLMRSVYFDVCFYCWDKVRPMPEGEQRIVFADLGPEGSDILDALVSSGRLSRLADGALCSDRAVFEAERAFNAWDAKSRGGRHARGGDEDSGKSAASKLEDSSREQDQEQEQDQQKEREAKASPKKIGSRLSDPFEMPVEWKRWAVGQGMDLGDVAHEATTFVRYWQAKTGKDATKLDWFKTWQNWIDRKLKEGRHGSRNREHPLGRTGSAIDTVLAGQSRSDR